MRFSTSVLFTESGFPGPLSIPLGSFRFLSKIRGENREWMFISGIKDSFKLLRSPGIDSASLCSLSGRYDNPAPTRFLVPIVIVHNPKIPAQLFLRYPWLQWDLIFPPIKYNIRAGICKRLRSPGIYSKECSLAGWYDKYLNKARPLFGLTIF